LDPSRNTDSSTGLTTQLEWVPDFRFPIISWLYSLSRIVTNTMYVSSPYASPASAIGYTLVMYVAFLFHTDASHALATSPAAQEILNNAVLSRFFDMLLDLPVPDFAHNEFSDLQAFLPDDIPALAFISCLASADYYHDFGRHISANVFFLAHNLLSTMPGNTQTSVLRSNFYRSTVNSVNIGNQVNVNITPANLFGRINGNASVTNWLNERIDAMINSMAIRAVNQNNIVAQVQFPTIALGNTATYNPYTFLTCASPTTIHSITSTMRNLSQWTQTTFPRSHTLRHYLQFGSHKTANYLYATVALPTWNTQPVTHTGNEMPTESLTDDALATENNFLVTPTAPLAADANGYTVFNVTASRNAATPPQYPLYARLASTVNQSDPYANPLSYESYDTEFHLLPRTYIFAPYSVQTGDLGSVILSGKWIESGDISGIMTPVPTPDTGLLYENSQFHSGAIRLSRTRKAFFDRSTHFHVQSPNPRTSTDAHTAFFRGFLSGLRLPLLTTRTIRAPGPHATHHERLVPGAEFISDVVDTDHTVNVFGSSLAQDLSVHESTEFSIWSSLRFRHHTTTGPVIHILPTARHIFGARARSYGTVHPALRLPL
jgi:hypothetical protein